MREIKRLVKRLTGGYSIISLLFGLGCVGQGMTAASFTGQVEGRFVNPSGSQRFVTGVGTAVFGWGKLRSSSLVPNQFGFESGSFAAEEGEPFVLGVFEYSNGLTDLGTNAESVDLEIMVTLADSLPRSFPFPLVIGTTVNNGDSEDSSDSFSLGSSTSEQVILIGGERFVLHIEFGRTTEDGFGFGSDFSVFENSVATAEIIGTIT